MWIKICANTSLEDARLAANAGADAVGFVFAPSPRQITPEQAAQIAPALPPDPTQIGVFITHDFAEIAQTLRTTGLHGAQIHDPFHPGMLRKLRDEFGHQLFLVPTISWSVEADPEDSEQHLRDQLRAIAANGLADAVLLDARTTHASGGTGKSLPWDRARKVIAAEAGKLRIVLAGGLAPDNVAEAIRTLRPWGVDVASGVESAPGKKDPARVQAFIRNARVAFAAIENRPLTVATQQ
jgi:phosphoribosylanthranilate isomerase